VGGYAIVSLVSCIATFSVSQWFRKQLVAAPDRLIVISVIAGLLWPLMLLGLVQLAAIIGVAVFVRRRRRHERTVFS